jgi:hypothetical protein
MTTREPDIDVWESVRQAQAYENYLEVQKIHDVVEVLVGLNEPMAAVPPRTDLPLSIARSFG